MFFIIQGLAGPEILPARIQILLELWQEVIYVCAKRYQVQIEVQIEVLCSQKHCLLTANTLQRYQGCKSCKDLPRLILLPLEEAIIQRAQFMQTWPLTRTQRMGRWRDFLLQRLRENKQWSYHIMVDLDLLSFGTAEAWSSLLCVAKDLPPVLSFYGKDHKTGLYGDFFALRTAEYPLGPTFCPWYWTEYLTAHRQKWLELWQEADKKWHPVLCAFGWCCLYKRTLYYPNRVSYIASNPIDFEECEHVILQRILPYGVMVTNWVTVEHP